MHAITYFAVLKGLGLLQTHMLEAVKKMHAFISGGCYNCVQVKLETSNRFSDTADTQFHIFNENYNTEKISLLSYRHPRDPNPTRSGIGVTFITTIFILIAFVDWGI